MSNEMIERFWSYIKIGRSDECWNWQGHTQANRSGMLYGYIKIDGKMCRCNRVAWNISNKEQLIHDEVIRHSCDNTLCCNPTHLIKGTQRENVEDTFDRCRENILCGSNHGMAKLTEEQVKAIKLMLTKNYGQRYIAKQFGVSQNQISRISSGKDWKHV